MTPYVTVAGVPLEAPTIRNVTPVVPRKVAWDKHSRYEHLFETMPIIWEVSGEVTEEGRERIHDTDQVEPIWVLVKWDEAVVVFSKPEELVVFPTARRAKTAKLVLTFAWGKQDPEQFGFFYSPLKRDA